MADRAPRSSRRSPPTARCTAHGWRPASTPGSARALGVRTAIADRVLLAAVAVAVVVSLDAVGALLVAVVLVVPAATVRLVAGDVRTLQLGTVALAAAEGLTALLIADSLDIGPGPGDGGARRRRVRVWRRCAAMSLVRAEDLAGGYAPGRDALEAVSFALEPGRSPACSGPTAAARRRCSARCSASCRTRRGDGRAGGPPGLRAADRRTRGWTSRSARSTSR